MISIGNAVVKAVDGTIYLQLTNFTGNSVTLKKFLEMGTLEKCDNTILSEFTNEHSSVSQIFVEEDSSINSKSMDKFL